MNVQNILTVSQLAELNPAFTEPTLRWWIFHADRFDFNKCLIRIGLRAFTEWLDAHRAEAFNDNIEVVE